MPDVEFNEAPSYAPALPHPRGITRFLLDRKLAKDEREASVIMLSSVVVALILTALLWVSGFTSGSTSSISPQERERLEAMP